MKEWPSSRFWCSESSCRVLHDYAQHIWIMCDVINSCLNKPDSHLKSTTLLKTYNKLTSLKPFKQLKPSIKRIILLASKLLTKDLLPLREHPAYFFTAIHLSVAFRWSIIRNTVCQQKLPHRFFPSLNLIIIFNTLKFHLNHHLEEWSYYQYQIWTWIHNRISLAAIWKIGITVILVICTYKENNDCREKTV